MRILTLTALALATVVPQQGKKVPTLQPVFEMQGHEGGVSALDWNADSTRLATASHGGFARIWDTEALANVFAHRGHKGSIRSIAWDKDGWWIVTAGDDKSARVYAADGEQLAFLRGHPYALSSAIFDPNGARVITCSAGRDEGLVPTTVRLWDPDGGQPLGVVRGLRGRCLAAGAPDGEHVVVAGEASSARIVAIRGGADVATLAGTEAGATCVAWSLDGARIAVGAADGSVHLFTADGASVETIAAHAGAVLDVVFAPDSTRLLTAGADDKLACLWSAADGALVTRISGHVDVLRDIAFAPDGSRVATASDDLTARIWNAADGSLIAVLRGHGGPVTCVGFSPDGVRLATGSDDGKARLWVNPAARKKGKKKKG